MEDWEKLQGVFIDPGLLSLTNWPFVLLSFLSHAKSWRYIIYYKTSFCLKADRICGSKNSETEMVLRWTKAHQALPWWLSGKESTCQWRRCRFDPWVGMIPWRGKWQPTPVFLPGKSHGQRSLGATDHGLAKSQMTEWCTQKLANEGHRTNQATICYK